MTIFKEHGVSPIHTSMILVMAQVSKMLFDIPSGLISDFFGRRTTLILGQIMRGVTVTLLLLKPCLTSFFIGMAFWGAALSCFLGNIEAYTYDYMRIYDHGHKFPRFMGYYYMLQNAAIAIASFLGGYVYQNSKVYMFGITIFFILMGVFIALQLPPYDTNDIFKKFPDEKKDSKKSFFGVVRMVIDNKKILFFILITGLCDSLFLFFYDLNTMSMNAMNYPPSTISVVVGMVAAAKIFGNMIAGYAVPFLSIWVAMIVVAFIMAFVMFNAILFGNGLIVAISTYLIIYTFTDLALKSKMQKYIPSAFRATVMSIENLIVSILLILINISNGWVANSHSYSVSITMIIGVALSCLLFLSVFYINVFHDKNHHLI